MANLPIMTNSKVALVTGASRGIGRSIALKLAEEGYHIALCARNREELQQVAVDIRNDGGVASAFPGSVVDAATVEKTVSRVMEKWGRIDLLVNNAGIGVFHAIESFSESDWDSMMEVNVKGNFLYCRSVIPHMKAKSAGHIINIASDVSRRTFSNGAAYCASKYAQDAMTSGLRKEIRKYGIKVSIVYPGLVDTHFHSHKVGSEKAKNWLSPDDIADAVTYIAQAPSHVVIDELMVHPLSQEY